MIDLSRESEQELERMATRIGYTTPEGRVEAQRELSKRYGTETDHAVHAWAGAMQRAGKL